MMVAVLCFFAHRKAKLPVVCVTDIFEVLEVLDTDTDDFIIVFNTARPSCILKYLFLSCTYITFQKPKSLVNVVKPLQINNPKLRGYFDFKTQARCLKMSSDTRLLVLANRYVKTFLSEHLFLT